MNSSVQLLHLREDFRQDLFATSQLVLSRAKILPNSGLYSHAKSNVQNGLSGSLQLYNYDDFDPIIVDGMLLRGVVHSDLIIRQLESQLGKHKVSSARNKEQLQDKYEWWSK